MNPRMPYTFGDGEIPLELDRRGLEVDEPSDVARLSGRPTRRRTSIGERVARFADDGTTLQFGIGLIPTVAATMMSSRRGSAGLVGDDQRRRPGRSHRRRCTRSRPPGDELLPDRLTRTLPLGGRERAAPHAADRDRQRPGAHRRANLHALRSTRPCRSTSSPRPTPASSTSRSTRDSAGSPTSSPGPCTRPEGTRSWPCTPGTTRPTRPPLSRSSTNPVTSFQHSAMISEHGCAELFGRSQHAQAQLLIDQVADPRARHGLAEASGRLGLRVLD